MNFYRYELVQYASMDSEGEFYVRSIPHPSLRLNEYDLLKETEKGYWIGFGRFGGGHFHWKKWIPKVSKKRYAYPTKEEAMTNFIKRTEKRIKILENQISFCKIELYLANNNIPMVQQE